jgi:hypothetical protein
MMLLEGLMHLTRHYKVYFVKCTSSPGCGDVIHLFLIRRPTASRCSCCIDSSVSLDTFSLDTSAALEMVAGLVGKVET